MGLINTEKLQRFYNTLKTHAFEVTSPDITGEVTFNNTDNLSQHVGKIEFKINDLYNKIYILSNIIKNSGVNSTELDDLITELQNIISPTPAPTEEEEEGN